MATLQDYYNTGDSYNTAPHGANTWYAQTFTANKDYTILSVKLLLYRVNEPGTLTVAITATDGSGHPTGADLCSGTTDADTLTTNSAGEWREITFGAPYSLSSSVKYAIILKAPGANGSSILVLWRVDSASPTYSGGTVELTSDGGSSWIDKSNYDAMFETYSSSWPSGTIEGTGGQSGVLTFDVLGLAGTIVGVAVASGPIVAERSISGTIAGVSTLSGPLSGAVVIITGTIVAAATLSSNILLVNILRVATISNRRRLIAVGNNKLYYEDI